MFGRSFSRRISAWRRSLASESPEQRRAAAKEIREASHDFADPSEVVPLLETMMTDPDTKIVECATSALCRCGVSALPVLDRMVRDSAAQLRESACYIIGHIKGDTRPLHAAVFAALTDVEPGVRAQAAFALGRMADRSPVTVDALAAAVRDPAPKVRLWALEAFRIFSLDDRVSVSLAPHAATILAALADLDSDVRKSALSALEEFELPADQLAAPLLDRMRVESHDEVMSTMRQLIDRRDLDELLALDLPALIAAAAANPRAAALVFGICGNLGARATAALPQLEDVVASPEVPYEAVEALWKITGDSTKCIPALERLLQRSWFTASSSLALLSKISDGSRYVIPMLRHAIPNSPDEAAGMIVDLGPAAAPLLPDLVRAIDENWDEPDWDLIWALTGALCALESSEPLAVSTLAKLLTHESPRVRYNAVEALGRAGPAARSALDALRQAEGDEDTGVAKAARAAIREIGRAAN